MDRYILDVTFSTDRFLSGVLEVRHGLLGTSLGRFEALGRGSRGRGDTQLLERGNTPTGLYRVTQLVDTSDWAQRSYGPHGALRLEPLAGAAADAAALGRAGILIHGGALGGPTSTRGPGELRPTLGCIRLSNDDLLALIRLLFGPRAHGSAPMCLHVDIEVRVRDVPMSLAIP